MSSRAVIRSDLCFKKTTRGLFEEQTLVGVRVEIINRQLIRSLIVSSRQERARVVVDTYSYKELNRK